MALPYHHTQRGRVMVASFGVGALMLLLGLTSALKSGTAPAGAVAGLAVAFVIFLVVGWWFSSMTIEVSADELRWHFRPSRGYRIARAEIESAQVVRHPWWSGYGIRFRGLNRRIYIVAGRDAVEVRLRDGGWRRLGTDDPQGLLAALNAGAR